MQREEVNDCWQCTGKLGHYRNTPLTIESKQWRHSVPDGIATARLNVELGKWGPKETPSANTNPSDLGFVAQLVPRATCFYIIAIPLHRVQGACSVAASYKPPMLVAQAQLHLINVRSTQDACAVDRNVMSR